MAQYEEFTIDQGTDVAIEVHCIDENGNVKDLSNHTVSAEIKKSYSTASRYDNQSYCQPFSQNAKNSKLWFSF